MDVVRAQRVGSCLVGSPSSPESRFLFQCVLPQKTLPQVCPLSLAGLGVQRSPLKRKSRSRSISSQLTTGAGLPFVSAVLTQVGFWERLVETAGAGAAWRRPGTTA